MSVRFETLSGLSAQVDKVVYDPTLSAPEDRPHPFIYHISIHNGSAETVTLFGRKWIVRDGEGETLVVEGDGIVGQFPRLAPGQSFSYNSYHVIRSESTATGTFFGATVSGKPICVRVPHFDMHPPQWV